MEEKKELKVLRVGITSHQLAKSNAARRGLNMQQYIEYLIQADEEGRLQWLEKN